ncbi:bleomycin resistance family protein [Pseudomonas sp. S37]|nr:bleomycin resistance family protein [Pseudomonas sp. S37]
MPTQCSATFYLHVADVEQYFDGVKDNAQVAWPLQDMPYGSREFGVRDCNGYYLAFAQVVDQTRSSNLEAKKVPCSVIRGET